VISNKEKTMSKTNRLQLLKKFWLMANEVGKDFAYDVVESLYHHRSLRILTLAELDKTVRELQKKSQFKFERNPKARRFFVLPGGFFENLGLIADISTPLKKKLQVMVQEAGISISTLTNLVKKMAAPGGYFGISQAQKVIEALKNMKETGWKETGTPQRTPRNEKSAAPKDRAQSFLDAPEKLIYKADEDTIYGLTGHWWAPRNGHA
jgi:hypothetical protein